MFPVFIFYLLATHFFCLSSSKCFPRLQLSGTSAFSSHGFGVFLFPLLLHFVTLQGTRHTQTHYLIGFLKFQIKQFHCLNCSTYSVIQYFLTHWILWATCIFFILFSTVSKPYGLLVSKRQLHLNRVVFTMLSGRSWGCLGCSSYPPSCFDLWRCRDLSSFLLSRTVWALLSKSFVL